MKSSKTFNWAEGFAKYSSHFNRIDLQGPWMEEPDQLEWIDPETKLNCLIRRSPLGALCGYVGVDPTNRLYGKHYNYWEAPEGKYEPLIPRWMTRLQYLPRKVDPLLEGLRCHWGLTFSDFWPEIEPYIWWFGFDCGHAGDLTPLMPRNSQIFFGEEIEADVYRDIEYVKNEVTNLALQISNVTH